MARPISALKPLKLFGSPYGLRSNDSQKLDFFLNHKYFLEAIIKVLDHLP